MLQLGRVNPDIRVKWVTFSPDHAGTWVKLKKSGFIILSNIAVTIILVTVLLESIDRFIINVLYSTSNSLFTSTS